MIRNHTNIFIIFALIGGLGGVVAKISDRRLCADAECKEVIGLGRTVLKYHAPDQNMLSFNNNQEVKIFSKEAGSNLNLWGVMIEGRRGYVHKNHIQEQKVYKKELKYEVSTTEVSSTPNEENKKDIEQGQETKNTNSQQFDNANQVTPSAENMEYGHDHVKPSYSNTNGDYNMVDAGIPMEKTPALDAVNIKPTMAINSNMEVIDGTTIYLDGEPSGVVPEKVAPPIVPTMTSVPKLAPEVPEIQSPVVSHQHQGGNIDLSQPGLEVGVEQPPTKFESMGLPEVEITTPIPDDVPNTSENIGVVPSNTILHTTPEYPSNLDASLPEETVAMTEESKHHAHEEYKYVETQDNEEEEEIKEEYEENNDNDSKEDFQAHIDNLKKAYTEEENTQNQVGIDEIALNTDTVSSEMLQPQVDIGAQSATTPDKETIPHTEMEYSAEGIHPEVFAKSSAQEADPINDEATRNVDDLTVSANLFAANTIDADIKVETNNVPYNGIGHGAASAEQLQVNPEGRDIEVTFHDETDVIVMQSKENFTNTVEEVNTDDMNSIDNTLPDSLAGLTVLSNEDVSGEMIPPISTGEEQKNPSVGEEQENPHVEWMMQFVPSWLHSMSHGQNHSTNLGNISGDQLVLLVIVAITLLFLHLINQCLGKASREKPLIAKLAELDKKLFNVQNELLITKNELQEKEVVTYDPAFIEHVGDVQQKLDESENALKNLKMEICQISSEKENVDEEYQKMNEYNGQLLAQLDEAQRQQQTAAEKAKQAEEMMEEMIQFNTGRNNNDDHEQFIGVVKKLQEQLEGQKKMLARYEPKYKKKEKEAKELSKEAKQLKVDLANARLEADKLKNELAEANNTSVGKEDEWKKLADLLQSQLDEKSEVADNMEKEVSKLKSLLNVMENEVEAKEEQREELQEILTELEIKQKKQKTNDWEEGEGWDLEEEKSMDDVKEIAKLKVEARKATDAKNKLEIEAREITEKISDLEQQLKVTTEECEFMRKSRDEAFKKGEDSERQLEVLTEYFNKKETELQKQLGLQTAKFGDVSTDAESTAKKLLSVMSELESTQDALKAVKREMEEQEKSLKAEIASHEKRAHENWIAAKQVDRKLTDVQGEMSILRNKLTTVEEKNASLELQNEDLQNTIQIIQQTKADAAKEYGSNASMENLYNSEAKLSPSTFSPNEATLPPLPGLDLKPTLSGLTSLPGTVGLPPNLMMPPMLSRPIMDTRLPPLGQMSPGPRERYSHRSPSPELDRYRPHSPSSRFRDSSPSSRSDRRSQRRISPSQSEHGFSSDRRGQRGPSPSRSERGISPNRRGPRRLSPTQSDRGGSPYSHRQASPPRTTSPDNSSNSMSTRDMRRDDNYRRRRRDRMSELSNGPMTSSPLDQY